LERSACLKKLNTCLEALVVKRWNLRQQEGQNSTRRPDVLDQCMSRITTWNRSMILQLRDEIKTLLLAGHETSAALLTWALFELSINPNIAHQVVQEHEEVFGKHNDKNPSVEQIKSMKWAPAILRETLRKYSVVPLVARCAAKDDVIPREESGLDYEVTIPKGTTVMVGIEGVHSRPDLWSSPESFQPQRFFNMDEVNPYAFIPFINGPRNCLGQHFSLLETHIVLSHLINEFDFALVGSPDKVGKKHDFIIPVVPVNGLHLIPKPRHN
jgi:cytochrome P450